MSNYFFAFILLFIITTTTDTNAKSVTNNKNKHKLSIPVNPQQHHSNFVAVNKTLTQSARNNVFEISHPGANFIKLKISDIQLTKGDVLLVSNPSGSENYHYSYQTLKDKNTFSLLSISGDKAIVTLVNSSNAKSTSHVKLLGYWVNTNHLTSTRSTCGSSQRNNVSCYSQTHPMPVKRANPVAKLWAAGLQCTAWRIGAGNRFLTNNHCMSRDSTAEEAELWFNYQYDQCSGSRLNTVVKVPVKAILKTNFNLDYTLFEVNDFDSIKQFGYIGLDLSVIEKGLPIFIPQHGDGAPKQLAIFSDQNASGLCEIDNVSAKGNVEGSDYGYLCDTLGGSSGSPVMSEISGNAIALHHFGGCENKGVKLSLIWPQIKHFFHDESPTNDDRADLVNSLPILDFDYQANQLTADIINLSTDNDGQIRSHRWRIDKQIVSEEANPKVSFNATGTYNVQYSAIDDDDAPQYLEKEITVIESTPEGSIKLGNGLALSITPVLEDRLFVSSVADEAHNLSIILEDHARELYVRKGAAPTTTLHDCYASNSTHFKECFFSKVIPGDYYIKISAGASGPSTLLATSVSKDATESVSWLELSGIEDDWYYFSFDVPAGMGQLSVSTEGGNGDVDLYLQRESLPTENFWTCFSDNWGNDESCIIKRPKNGKWYIALLGRWDFDDVKMKATATP